MNYHNTCSLHSFVGLVGGAHHFYKQRHQHFIQLLDKYADSDAGNTWTFTTSTDPLFLCFASPSS